MAARTRSLRTAVGSLFLSVTFSGCVEPPEPYEFPGTFTDYAKGQDVADFRRRMAAWTAEDVLVYETFPYSFLVRGLVNNCEKARAEAADLNYIAKIEACREAKSVATFSGSS